MAGPLSVSAWHERPSLEVCASWTGALPARPSSLLSLLSTFYFLLSTLARHDFAITGQSGDESTQRGDSP